MRSGPNVHPSLTDGTFDHLREPKPPLQGPAKGPDADGERLATLERKDGQEELRIEQREYNGYPYTDLRVWYRNEEGEWRPSKTGVTVKPRELADVIAALQKAKGQTR